MALRKIIASIISPESGSAGNATETLRLLFDSHHDVSRTFWEIRGADTQPYEHLDQAAYPQFHFVVTGEYDGFKISVNNRDPSPQFPGIRRSSSEFTGEDHPGITITKIGQNGEDRTFTEADLREIPELLRNLEFKVLRTPAEIDAFSAALVEQVRQTRNAPEVLTPEGEHLRKIERNLDRPQEIATGL